MSIHKTLPADFEEKIKTKLGSDFGEFISSLQQPAPVSIRINSKKKWDIPPGENVPWAQTGRYLDQRPSFTLDPFFHGGAYYVQEASSMFLEQVISQVDHQKNIKVLDLCAAPGGKSTHLLSLLPEDSLLVSNEVIRSRATILAENIQKWGHQNVIVTNNDPRDFSQLHGFFDIIVVDAPCSGEGLFRKDPDAIAEWSPNNVALCAMRQQRIIKDVWPSLKEDGLLIYCTCTYNEEENEENMVWLQSKVDVEQVPLRVNADWGVEEVTINKLTGYRFYPHRAKGEGFFLCAMRKKEPQTVTAFKNKKPIVTASRIIKERLSPWVTSTNSEFFQWHDILYMLPEAHMANVQLILNKLNVIIAGTYLATLKHDKLVPEHALALSCAINRNNFDSLDLTLNEAIAYLRKDLLNIEYTLKGFVLVTYNDLPIGWINALANRINNLYPKEWRIRMAV